MTSLPFRRRTAALCLTTAALVVACSGAASGPVAPSVPRAGTPSPTSVVSPADDPWTADLDGLDQAVRRTHVSPFTIHSEAEWIARLADVRGRIVAASPDEQLVLLASLVGLLDTHSALGIPGGAQFYELVVYPFSDGWFVIRAADPSLVGARVLSIGGVAIDEVADRLTPLVPHDNASGRLFGLEWLITQVAYLHGAGIVGDTTAPAFHLAKRDGSEVTVNPDVEDQTAWEDQFHVSGALLGDAPEAVARRDERIWTRLDAAHRAFLIAVNDYGDMTDAIDAMTSALDRGDADRVVVDTRYLRGGNGDIRLLDALIGDPRINRPGGLTVLTSRENESAATQVAQILDTQTAAVLVGEPTPARADNFTCPCTDLTLPRSGYVVTVPTAWDHNGDPRPAVAPDIPMKLSSVDFFAGRDPVLDAALAGLSTQPSP